MLYVNIWDIYHSIFSRIFRYIFFRKFYVGVIMKKKVALVLSLVIAISVCLCAPCSASSLVAGDTDLDGTVTVADAFLALHHSVDKRSLRFDGANLADITQDQKITTADALVILQYAVGLITEFDTAEQVVSNTFEVMDSNVENDAYTIDTSYDSTFIMDNTGLAPYTAYYVYFSTAPTVHEYRMMYAFQGLLNRDYGRDANHTSMLYFQKDDGKRDNSDAAWFEYITREGNYFDNLTKVTINTVSEFYSTFQNQLRQCGYISWDPNVPATANVALTICGLDGYLPVQPGTQVETALANIGVEEKMSLEGMFLEGATTLPGSTTASSGSTKNDAYLWALEKYFDRCSYKYIAYTLDGAPQVASSPFSQMTYAYHACTENHDYIVARRCFVIDLYPYGKEAPCDDPNQPVGTDLATMKQLFARRYERANGEFGQLLGFPPWYIKYSSNMTMPDGTLTGSMPATWIEWCFTEILTCYNLAKEADAVDPPSMNNGSFYYKYRIPADFEFKNNTPEKLTFDEETYYFTIYSGDYDSSAWLKRHVWYQWYRGDSARGTLPMNWAFNPNLSNRVPMIFQYVYENKTANDYFVGGDSGAGYVIPIALQPYKVLSYAQMMRPPKYGSGLDAWAEYSRRYYDIFDYDITGFIINGSNSMNNTIFEAYNKISPVGSFHNDSSKKLVIYKGVPYVHLHNGIGTDTDPDTIYKHAFSNMGCNFSGYRTVIATPSQTKTIVDNYVAYATGKGKKVMHVDMYTLFDLIRQSGQGTIVN